MFPTTYAQRVERDRLERVFRRYLAIAFTDPVITVGKSLEHGKVTGCVLVAVEGDRKSIQIIPDRLDPRRGQGW